MRAVRRSDMFEELKAMKAGSRLGEVDGAMVVLEPGESPRGVPFEELFVKRDVGTIADARTWEIVWPVEDE